MLVQQCYYAYRQQQSSSACLLGGDQKRASGGSKLVPSPCPPLVQTLSLDLCSGACLLLRPFFSVHFFKQTMLTKMSFSDYTIAVALVRH